MHGFFAALNYAVTGIIALEQVIPQGGFGSTKKEIILNGITAAAQAGGIIGTTLGKGEISAISAFIDMTVKSLNASGIFKTTTSAAAAS